MLLRGILLASLMSLVPGIVSAATPTASVSLAWDPVGAGTAGYHLYQGTSSANYATFLDTRTNTIATVTNLTRGATYYFAVTSYSADGLESLYSSEVAYTVPLTTPGPALKLRISSTRQVILSASAPAGYVYDVQMTTNLTATTSWSKLASVTASSAGTLGYTNGTVTGARRFYRLRQTSP